MTVASHMPDSSQCDQLPRAVVIGLDTVSGLQAARILAARKIPVIGIARDPSDYRCRTNVCSEIITSDARAEALLTTLETLGPRLPKKAVLFPCNDMYVLHVSRHRHRLEAWYHVVLAPPDVIEMLMDKVSFYEFAQREGLSIPRTLILKDRADAVRAAEELEYPCVLKPPAKTREWEGHTKSKVFKITNKKDLLSLYDRCSGWAPVLIVQEWVEGPEDNLYSCNCYFSSDSEPLVTFVARKIRQWRPQTGFSSLGEECRNDTVLEETVRLFRSTGYRGLGYLEMKRDERTGKYFLMETNVGRPTGRSAIAEAGGVELLYTMYCDAVGWPLPQNRVQRYEGVKWIFLRNDLRSAFHYWRRGELSLGEWLTSWRGRKAYAVFSWRDPGPFIGDLLRTLHLLLSPHEQEKHDSQGLLQ